ncbi:MAG: histidinol dehydrogenase [Ruminococcaceae bacterium]|nr:histidinol dehydrogenase [Oscillospiraceae bacterium]
MISVIKSSESDKFIKELKQRSGSVDAKVTESVTQIIKEVAENGDKALRKFTKQFDNIDIDTFEVDKSLLRKGYENSKISSALEKAAENIRRFHEKQKQNGYIQTGADGIVMGQRVIPIEKVGIYVPGGTAAYPSSVLMNAIPAKVAGVDEIIMITPPGRGVSDDILAAAYIAGVDRLFMVGGAHGVAALAYGTEQIPKVDKIVGPGNIFVATAKKLLYGIVDIDMIAGPSEILIIADDKAPAASVAADLMSQAEHDVLSSSILLCLSEQKANEVISELERQVKTLSREEIIRKSLKEHGVIMICENVEEEAAISNKIAPEHLELCVENPFELLNSVRNAGSVFMGYSSPEPLGDYYAGPNHVLPTSGTARFFSALSVDSFIKKSSYLYYSEIALNMAADDVISIAEAEGLTAHANSIKVRTGK